MSRKYKYKLHYVDAIERCYEFDRKATLEEAIKFCKQWYYDDLLIKSVYVTKGDEIIWHIEQEGKNESFDSLRRITGSIQSIS